MVQQDGLAALEALLEARSAAERAKAAADEPGDCLEDLPARLASMRSMPPAVRTARPSKSNGGQRIRDLCKWWANDSIFNSAGARPRARRSMISHPSIFPSAMVWLLAGMPTSCPPPLGCCVARCVWQRAAAYGRAVLLMVCCWSGIGPTAPRMCKAS